MIFDHSDAELIRELLKDGMPFKEVANKWGVTSAQLVRFCARHKISYRICPNDMPSTTKEIIRLHKSCSVDEIARLVNRSERTVRRVIQTHCRDTYTVRCQQRVDAVTQLMQSQGLTAKAACGALGITYGAFDYARRIVKKG